MPESTLTKGRIVASVTELEIVPSGTPNGEVVIFVGGHGRAAADAGKLALPSQLADRGYTVLSGLFGSGATWGSDAFLTPFGTFVTYAEGRGDKVHVVAASMGGLDVLNWTRRNPGRVDGIALIAPCVQMQAFHGRNPGGLASSMETAYTNLAGLQAAFPTRDPIRHAVSAHSAEKIAIWQSTNDPLVLPAEVNGFATLARCPVFNQGLAGHTYDGIDPDEIDAHLKRS